MENQPKHTPCQCEVASNRRGYFVKKCSLCAAAPELLDAAKAGLFLLDKKYPPGKNICIIAEKLRAAIAKAEGK